MKSRARHILNSALAAIGIFAAGTARGEVVGCGPLSEVKTPNRYEFDSSTCDFSNLAPDDKKAFAEKRQELADKITVIDYQIIAPITRWLDPENAIPKITVKLESRETLKLDGKFSPDQPSTIVLADDIFTSSATSFVAFHELQHLYNFHFKGDAYVDDWLNEGLSEFVQYYYTNKIPEQAIDKIELAGRTPPLLDFSNETGDTEGRVYTNTGLFVTYLARHFGGLDFVRLLIRSPQTGFEAVRVAAQTTRKNHGIEDKYINLNSLFLNYSVALAVNSKRNSYHDLFSFDGADFFGLLTSIRVDGQLLVLPVARDHLEQTDSLAPYQSEFYIVPSDYKCLRVDAPTTAEIYKIVVAKDRISITPIQDRVPPETQSFKLLVVNYDKASTVTFSEGKCN